MASYCGKGATGRVYEEMRRGQWAAVKKVHGDLMTCHDMDREYEIYKAAEHPNIVKLVERPTLHYDYMWHIPMEYIFGEDLETIMFHPRRSSIRVESETYRPVNIDMGFAKFFRNCLSSAQDRGNPAYAAPEILGKPQAKRDFRSDVWAMGRIITELLIGYRIPDMYMSPAHIQDTLEGNVYCDVVCRMLEGSPIPRVTMAEVIDDIRAAGRAAAERQSLSIPSSMQVAQYQRSGERDGNFSALMSYAGLPPNFHLPDNVPANSTVNVHYIKFDSEGEPMSRMQGEVRFRDGRLADAWWINVTPDRALDY